MKTKILTTIFTVAILANSTSVKARDCKTYTYDNTRTERQALHHKQFKSKAHQIVRMIEACQVQINGGFDVRSTQDLHYSNDAELNYNNSAHVAGRY